jgi:hypothetical protein
MWSRNFLSPEQLRLVSVYHMWSSKAHTRYTSRSKPIKFLDDNNISSAEWPTAFLHLEYNRTGLSIYNLVRTTRSRDNLQVHHIHFKS